MSVGSVGGAGAAPVVQAPQRAPESSEVKGAPDRDGDADDGGGAVKAVPPASVNLNGQRVGQLVNVVVK
jgi:hypothetical protein